MNQYQVRKARAREKALQFQDSFANGTAYSYGELAIIQAAFKRLARRYGLVREFKENGII